MPREQGQHKTPTQSSVAQAAAAALVLAALLVASTGSVLDFSENNLAFHMTVEHAVFFATGAFFVLVADRLQVSIRRRLGSDNASGLKLRAAQAAACLIASTALLALWHFPQLFSAAVFHENLHQLQHASFIVTGSIAFIALRSIPATYLILFVMLAGAAMGISGALLLVSGDQIFFPYSVKSHVEAGSAMIILAIVMAVAVIPAVLINHSLRHELTR